MARTAAELIAGVRVLCSACKRDDHPYCTMSRHCECEHLDDGTATREEFEAYHKGDEDYE
jgi:hypothetical protein